jgi:hypothetical protein
MCAGSKFVVTYVSVDIFLNKVAIPWKFKSKKGNSSSEDTEYVENSETADRGSKLYHKHA